MEGMRLVEPPGPLWLLSGQDPPEYRFARDRAGAMRPVIVGGPPDRDPRLAVAVRLEQLGSHFDSDPALAARRGSGQVLTQRCVNGPVRVQVVGEYQLGATGLGRTQDGTGQRGEQLWPLRVWRICAVIDDSGARRRSTRLGWVGRVSGHPLRPFRRPPTAADSPDTSALPQQLADHGPADGAGRA